MNFTTNQEFNVRAEFIISLILLLFVLVVFKKTGVYGFISFDDGLYVKDNPNLIGGISFQNIVWAFTTAISGNWHPVTWISYMLDIELYGINPGMFHMINVFLHALNTLLLFFILKNLTDKKWQSGVVAILFAIHPLHVESVVWISERKDVLSTFFGFLTIWFYAQYTKTYIIKNYLLAILFFIIGLMSKSMLVTIPFVLLLLDFWPLGRFPPKELTKDKISFMKQYNCLILKEKIPFLILSFCICVITFYTQKEGNAVATIDLYPAYLRVGNVIISYISYLQKIFYPINLSILYPRPESIAFSKILMSFCIFILLTCIIFKTYPRKPYLLTGWFWYLGTLIPVIGIVQIGMQGMADRYMYIPSVGVFIAIVWLIFDFCEGKKIFIRIGSITACILFMIFASLSYVQINYWKNSILLYKHSISVTKNNYVLHRFLGDVLMKEGKLDESESAFLNAIKINPKYVAAYGDLASLHLQTNRYESARSFLRKGLTINPDNTALLNNLGVTYAKLNNLESAIKYFKKALIIDPDYIDAKKNLKMAEKLINKI